MKIKQSVLDLLDNNRGYATLMLALDCSATSAREYVKGNKDELTKYKALEAIREFTGLTDSEILEEEIASRAKVMPR
jgi:hypothetical protein